MVVRIARWAGAALGCDCFSESRREAAPTFGAPLRRNGRVLFALGMKGRRLKDAGVVSLHDPRVDCSDCSARA